MPVRVLLVDDEPEPREALAALIADNDRYEVCGSVECAADAIGCLNSSHPDVVITDLNIPFGPDGIQLSRAIRALYDQAAVMVLSGHDESIFAERALLAGASGYLMKVDAPLELFEALDCVSQGCIYLSQTMWTQLYHRPMSEELTAEDRVLLEWLGTRNPPLALLAETSGMSEGQLLQRIQALAQHLGYVGQTQLRLYAARWTTQNGSRQLA
jgi:DNA-binding NarL/FixJ family response regulator